MSAALSLATSYYQSLFLPNKILQSSKQLIRYSIVKNCWLQTPPDLTLHYYLTLKGVTVNCSIIVPVAMSHDDANELHFKAKASARQAASSSWKTRHRCLCLLSALKGDSLSWICTRAPTAFNQLWLVISEPQLYCSAYQTPHHWEELQRASTSIQPEAQNSMTKIARIGLVPYQTEVTRMELLWMKSSRTFIFVSLWAALSRFPLPLKKVRLSLNRTNPPQLKGIFSKFRALTHTCA